jgi:hypothetical protein
MLPKSYSFLADHCLHVQMRSTSICQTWLLCCSFFYRHNYLPNIEKSVSGEQELPGKLFPSQTGRPFPVRNLTQVTFYTEVEFLRYLYTTELNRFVEFFATSSVRGGSTAGDSRIGKNMHYRVYGSLLKVNDYADRFQRLIQSF